jgi:hypothetical protein
MTLSLSFRQRTSIPSRNGQPQLEWSLRRADGFTVARYTYRASTFDPQRLVELVNRIVPARSRVDTIPVHLL